MKQAVLNHNQTTPQSFTHQSVSCLSLSNSREEQKHTLSETVASGMGFSSQTYSNMNTSNNLQLHANDSMPAVSVLLPDHALFSVTRTKSCKQNFVSESETMNLSWWEELTHDQVIIGLQFNHHVLWTTISFCAIMLFYVIIGCLVDDYFILCNHALSYKPEHLRYPEDCLMSPRPSGTADHPRYQGQLDLNQSMASELYPWNESYLGGFISACTQNPTMYPQTVSTSPARIPLPIRFTGTFPIYVNAKQYSAIIRRRKIRSKLEARNKLFKQKKPYLHESRHRHAVRRARGSGGRFLNSKTIENTKPISHNHVECQSHQNSQSGSWESSPRNSDITSIFNGGGLFPHQKLNDWNSSRQIGFSTMAVAEGLTARRI